MSSVRLIRSIALALALIWVPMSAFAQLCATHSLSMKMGGTGHPALPQTDAEHSAAYGTETLLTEHAVVDAEMFWHSVDSYDEPCKATAMCALANAVAVTQSSALLSLDTSRTVFFDQSIFPRSYERAPATPPPRSHL
jgi:hypothetical protein